MDEGIRFQPVQPVRAYERIVEQVEQAVFTGVLKPGGRLPSERELMAQFRVSRSTVREALRVLESNGLVRSRPGDPNGPEVLPFSTAGLEKSMTRLLRTDGLTLGELVQFRMLLDGSATLLAARLRTAEQLAEMEAALAAMEATTAAGYDEFSRADVAFHDAVARAAGSSIVQVCRDAVREVVLGLIANKIAAASDRSALMEQSLRHHREVLDAVRDGDGERAARLARLHIYEYYASHLPPEERRLLGALVDERSWDGAPDGQPEPARNDRAARR